MPDIRSGSIEVLHLSKQFLQRETGLTLDVLNDISFCGEPGTFLALVGESGCGKTTLLQILAGLECADHGIVQINGKAVSGPNADCGMMFQQNALFPWLTVRENIEFGPKMLRKSQQDQARINELLQIMRLEDFSNVYPAKISGGMQQRSALARALANDPKVLLCDEATSALDPNTTKSILELIKQINRDLGITVIVITHEMAVIEAICDRVAIIDHSQIAEYGRVSEIFSEPKSKIGRQLILGDAVENVRVDKSRKIRITFDGRSSMEPVLANMILASKVPVNILYASTKDIGGTAYGQMIIQLPEDETDAARALHYLKSVQVPYEEVNGNVI